MRFILSIVLMITVVSCLGQIPADSTKAKSALIVINGKPITGITVKQLDKLISPNDIESMSILKDKNATDKYGEKGKDGVIEIVTKNKSLKLEEINDDNDENIVFTKTEVEASFPGGSAGWRSFLETNLNANVPVDNGAPIGIYTVVVQFIVDKKGTISDVRMLTDFGYGMEEEVSRIIKISPQWVSAMQNGRTVKAYRKQPVTFVVEAEDLSIEMKEKYILYTGIENIVKINADNVKGEDLLVIPSQGTALPLGVGSFKIKVNTPGKAIISIYNKKENKPLGSVYFIVKPKL